MVIECRRLTTSGVKAEAVMGFAGRITDVRATGGYMVSPLGLQAGAELVAKYKGVHSIRIDAESTVTDFTVKFLDKVVHGASAHLKSEGIATASASVVKADGTVDDA